MWRDRARRHLPAFGGYVVLTAAFFWQVIAHINTRILSDGRDGATFLWSMWELPKELFAGHNPFVTDLIFHPVGARLGFHTNIPLESLLAAPVAKVFGFAVAANLVRLVATVLAGFGAYLLAFHECRARLQAFVAGAAFAVAPYQIANSSGHFNLQQTEFLPLGILALLLLYDRPTLARALAVGASLAACFWTDLYYTVFLVSAWGIIAVWRHRETMQKAFTRRAAQAAGVAAVLSAPLLVEMVRELVQFHELDKQLAWGQAEQYSADVLSWVTPPASHPLWGHRFAHMNFLVTGGDRLTFPGYALLALGGAGVVFGVVRCRHIWTVIAAVFGVLSFGPFLHIRGWHGSFFGAFGNRFSIPMPYALLHFVPILNGVRTPGRFSIMVVLALCVLAALALTRLARGYPRARHVICWGVLAVILVEFLPGQLPFQSASVPGVYRRIAADRTPGAVLELPIVWRWGFGIIGSPVNDASVQLYNATKHGKPIVSGFHARYPERRLLELSYVAVYRQVMSLQGMPGFYDPVTFGVEDLRRLHITWVVYHRDNPEPKALDYFSRLMPDPIGDGPIIAWKVPSRTS